MSTIETALALPLRHNVSPLRLAAGAAVTLTGALIALGHLVTASA